MKMNKRALAIARNAVRCLKETTDWESDDWDPNYICEMLGLTEEETSEVLGGEKYE